MSSRSPQTFYRVYGNGDPPCNSETSDPFQDLFRAAHRGDWAATITILQCDPSLRIATLNVELENVLHVAVGTGMTTNYVQKLICEMQEGELKNVDVYGQTPLMVATIIGNISAAKMLVQKNPYLLYVSDIDGLLPVHRAAQYGQKDMLLYLLKVTSSDNPCPYAYESGAKLLAKIIEAEFYDVATSLIRSFPQLIDESYTASHNITPPLTMLATNPCAFICMGLFRRLIYACIPTKWYLRYDHFSIGSAKRGEEYQLEQSRCPPGAVRFITSLIQHIRPTKSKRDQAIQLVNCLTKHASKSPHLSYDMFKEVFLLAAENGIVEIVEELAETFPNILWVKNPDEQNIFQVAVLCRHRRVYNLVYRIAKDKRYKTRDPDKNGNNILHMAGKLAPLHRLDLISGAALKMKYELQWFKEVGRSIHPFQRGARNKQNKTPKEVFTEEHKGLVKEGEKWMKSTASSCTTPAALIATVVFAAAITVPSSHIGVSGERAYLVFACADALSLFTSLASLLTFVSILTSRYTEDEFLSSLPRRILMGLFTLFVSISSMMVAFSMILYLAFGYRKPWVLWSTVAASFLPALVFVMLHYSLLADMVFYWIFPKIYVRKIGHYLYTKAR